MRINLISIFSERLAIENEAMAYKIFELVKTKTVRFLFIPNKTNFYVTIPTVLSIGLKAKSKSIRKVVDL
jgi:hypothetical protein